MTTAMASTHFMSKSGSAPLLVSPRGATSGRRPVGQASSLVQALFGAARRASRRLFPWRAHSGARAMCRDIARVRHLAEQVRHSQPGYAEDLMAAAATLEARLASR